MSGSEEMEVQVTLEQLRATYTRIFFDSKCLRATLPWLVRSTDAELQIPRIGGPTINYTRIFDCEEGGRP